MLERAVSTQSPSQHRGRVDFLDAIRGLAALSVVAQHFTQAYPVPHGAALFDRTPLHVWWDGFAAVSMFFVLSGVVLSMRYFRSGPRIEFKTTDALRFWIARIARIWMPYAAAMLIIAGIYAVTRKVHGLPTNLWTYKQSLSAKVIAKELVLFRMSPGPGIGYFLLPQAWTLSIELVISLLIPIAVVMASQSTLWLVLSALLCWKCGNMSVFTLHFMAGVLIGKHYQKLSMLKAPKALWLSFGALGFLAYSCGPMLNLVGDVLWITTGIGAAMLIMFCTASQAVQSGLSVGPLRYLGRTSYGLYLWHLVVINTLAPIVFSKTHSWCLSIMVVVGISLLVADVFYRFVEVPSIAIGKRLSKRVAEACSHKAVWSINATTYDDPTSRRS